MDGWYRTSSWIKQKILTNQLFPNEVFLPHKDIIELIIPHWAKDVNCYSNKITELIIPDSVKYIDCRSNEITELIVSDDCKVLCDDSVKIITRTMYNRSNRLKNILK